VKSAFKRSILQHGAEPESGYQACNTSSERADVPERGWFLKNKKAKKSEHRSKLSTKRLKLFRSECTSEKVKRSRQSARGVSSLAPLSSLPSQKMATFLTASDDHRVESLLCEQTRKDQDRYKEH
jgi:hypothetical protein